MHAIRDGGTRIRHRRTDRWVELTGISLDGVSAAVLHHHRLAVQMQTFSLILLCKITNCMFSLWAKNVEMEGWIHIYAGWRKPGTYGYRLWAIDQYVYAASSILGYRSGWKVLFNEWV